MKHRLNAKVLATNTITGVQKTMLYELYATYYEGFDEALFYQDLAEKHWIIVLDDQQGNIRGFSTLFVAEHEIDGKTIRSVFSGDTIIHHDFWGEQILPLTWCRFVGELKAQQPDTPLYWFLIVKGHRTYRYLRVFSKVFYPVHSEATPSHIQAIMDKMGADRFGQQYDAATGIVQFNQSHGYLKKQWDGIDQPALKKPDVHFFVQRNPAYQQGDEMVCISELTEDNLQRHALVAFREGLHNLARNFGC